MFQSNNNDLRVFCEKLLFVSQFSSESQVFLVGFLCVLKMYHVRFYIVEKMGFEAAPRRCGIHSKPQPLLQKICLFHVFETLVTYAEMCLCTHALVYVCKPAHVRRPRTTLSFYFQKQIFAHLKYYIFHFNTSKVNLILDWALNWP